MSVDRSAHLAAVEAYRVRNALPGTLEALMDMQANLGDLEDSDRCSYRVVYAGFRELFHGKEAA